MSSGIGYQLPRKQSFDKAVDDSESRTDRSAFETEVNDMLSNELTETLRDPALTSKRLDDIVEALSNEINGDVNLLFGGSVKKHTYIDGLSDVDVLVCIDRTDQAENSPGEILQILKSIVDAAGPPGVVSTRTGDMALTVTYENGDEIQILPALRKGEGFRIPSRSKDEWSSVVRPDKFASKLTEANQGLNGRLVPIIRLAKIIVSDYPESLRPTGYHIESMAIEAFKDCPQDLPRTPKALVTHFFDKARSTVLKSIGDPSGQSYRVDEYLGPNDSVERRRVADLFDRTLKKMKRADATGDSEAWRELIGT